MSGLRPVTIPRRVERDPSGGQRLERIMGYRPASPGPISALVDELGLVSMATSHVASYVDAACLTPIRVSDATTAIHILWTAPGDRAEIRAGVDPQCDTDLLRYEVHPGDTVLVPAGVPHALGAGNVAFIFGGASPRACVDRKAWSQSMLPHPPTHGLNLFHRFNRRTICAAHQDLLLERWKITQPLALRLRADRWHYVTNLVDPVGLNWPGGSALLQRTESSLLPRGLDQITIVPDGLGYVLIGSVPDLEADVVLPLRWAGYDRDAIASLGVPTDLLV